MLAKGLPRLNKTPITITIRACMLTTICLSECHLHPQHTMESILHGINQVSVYLDNNLITGRSDEEHLQRLRRSSHPPGSSWPETPTE